MRRFGYSNKQWAELMALVTDEDYQRAAISRTFLAQGDTIVLRMDTGNELVMIHDSEDEDVYLSGEGNKAWEEVEKALQRLQNNRDMLAALQYETGVADIGEIDPKQHPIDLVRAAAQAMRDAGLLPPVGSTAEGEDDTEDAPACYDESECYCTPRRSWIRG